MNGPVNILVVDDDPALVSAARVLLARRNCRLDAVFSGLDAVARVRAGGIDAVLLDVRMPQVDGLTVLDEISRLPNPPRVVFMTGHADPKVEEAVAAGRAIACLTKPIDFELALTLLVGEAPDRPLQLHPDLERSALASFASQALSRGVAFLEGAPQLPPGTAISLELSPPSGRVQLLAVAEPAVRPAGKRGLGLRLAPLTDAQVQALRTAISPAPAPVAAPKDSGADRAQELYRRGMEKLEAGKYDRALLDLRGARDLRPSDVLLQAAALRAEELAGVEKARGLYRRAQKLSESEPKEALRLIEDAVRLDPTHAAYHREAARLYVLLGDSIEVAEERLAASIHLAPSDPAPRIHLAQLLERAGKFKEANWACEAALGLFPGDRELQKIAQRLKRKAVPTRT